MTSDDEGLSSWLRAGLWTRLVRSVEIVGSGEFRAAAQFGEATRYRGDAAAAFRVSGRVVLGWL
ncbi:MAG TPA: hypothetical protein VK162_01850 [Streptosporangiaceae bacterium]|nr:hypothetical protein [Streptosporangiaceae bacterium]